MKMPTTVGIFIFISRDISMLSCVEHEETFITSGPAPAVPTRWLQCQQGSIKHNDKTRNRIKHENKPLRKHAYSNILKILPPKKENFQIKNSDIFHILAQKIDCGSSARRF